MCSRLTLCCIPLLAVHCRSIVGIPPGSETPAVVDRPSLMDPETRTKQYKNDAIDERTLAAIRRMTGLLSKSDRFAFQAHTVWESTRESGVRLEAEAAQQLWLDRPSRMFTTAAQVAREEGLAERGYRLVLNVGPDAGMTVHHLHLHCLGGRLLGPEG